MHLPKGSTSAAARPPAAPHRLAIALVRRQPGIALVAVLWIVTALSLLATGLAAGTRAHVHGAQAAGEFARAAALGDAAIQLAALELRGGGPSTARLVHRAYSIDGRAVEVEVVPAGGLVDLNGAPEGLLRDLFRYGAGLSPEAADTLAQRVLDWQDPDPAALPLGAEDEDYAQAGVRFRTRGGPFESTEDLLQVLGMNFDIYDRVRRLVTVFGAAAGVDPLAAPRGVLEVLAAGDEAVARRIAAARDAGEPAIDTSALAQAHLTRTAGPVYRIEARVPAADGAVLARTRWVDLGNGRSGWLPWRTLRIEPVRGVDTEA